jgi:acyl-CoA thioester hydrolase
MLSEHRLKRRVQFYETDAAGIVHFTNYARYMEEAEHAMWRAAGLSIHPKDTEMGWPRVAMTVEYHAPLRFEDEFEVVIRIAAMTRRSIRYACEMFKGEKRMASGSMTVVCAERKPHERARAIDIPLEVLNRFEVAGDPNPTP